MTELEKMLVFKEKGWKYNPSDGKLTGVKGGVCNYVGKNGYVQVVCKSQGKRFRVYGHRLAWFLYFGFVPNVIDHIDRNPANNKIDNLRSVNYQKNSFNIVGQGYDETKLGRFAARIGLNGKKLHLGTFDTQVEAHNCYLNAKKIYHKI